MTNGEAASLEVRDYISWPSRIRDMKVPSCPALYVWTRSISVSNGEVFESNLSNWLASSPRTDSAIVGPYANVTVQVRFPSLNENKSGTLRSIRSTSHVDWTHALISRWQRPLYVGITVNLRQRLDKHLASNSRLRQYMAEVGITPTDCQLEYYIPPYETKRSDEWEDESETGLDYVQESLLPTDLVENLRLTEALIIRLAQPYLNRAME